jgi:hypothetical protein
MGKRAKNTHFLFLLTQTTFPFSFFGFYQTSAPHLSKTLQKGFHEVFNRLLKTSENIFQKLCGELWGIV